MVSYIRAKTILSRGSNAPDPVFGLTYNMNLYRGCQHQCIYCDSRSLCYGIENFADILIKENALEILDKELRSKRKKGTIGTGSMNDPYMPVEKKELLTRGALEIINKYSFPVHILTKSALVLRDIDLIREIGKTYSAVSFTITAADDNLSKKIEPGAHVSSERFRAMNELSKAGVYTGLIMTPILPFITDSEKNIRKIIEMAASHGAKYILAWMGTTQRTGQREYFYKELDRNFPGIKEKYISSFGDNYECPSPDWVRLWDLCKNICDNLSIRCKIDIFDNKDKQIRLF